MLHRLAKLVKIRNITKLKKFNKPTKPVNAIALHINKSKKDPTDIAVDRISKAAITYSPAFAVPSA